MANMEWRFMVVSEVAVAEAPKQLAKPTAASAKAKVSTKSAPDGTAQQQAPGKEYELRVPVMINIKAIKADGELLIYRAPKQLAKPTAASAKAKVSTKFASDGTAQQQAPGKEYELKVPVMINNKAIKADDELLIYRAAKRKVERPPTSVKVAKLMKENAK